MATRDLTACSNYNQCYFVRAILALLAEYREALERMRELDVSRWGHYNRGAHHARIAACENTIDDLCDLISMLDAALMEGILVEVRV